MCHRKSVNTLAEELSWLLHGRFLQSLIRTSTYTRHSCHLLEFDVRIGPEILYFVV